MSETKEYASKEEEVRALELDLKYEKERYGKMVLKFQLLVLAICLTSLAFLLSA